MRNFVSNIMRNIMIINNFSIFYIIILTRIHRGVDNRIHVPNADSIL